MQWSGRGFEHLRPLQALGWAAVSGCRSVMPAAGALAQLAAHWLDSACCLAARAGSAGLPARPGGRQAWLKRRRRLDGLFSGISPGSGAAMAVQSRLLGHGRARLNVVAAARLRLFRSTPAHGGGHASQSSRTSASTPSVDRDALNTFTGAHHRQAGGKIIDDFHAGAAAFQQWHHGQVSGFQPRRHVFDAAGAMYGAHPSPAGGCWPTASTCASQPALRRRGRISWLALAGLAIGRVAEGAVVGQSAAQSAGCPVWRAAFQRRPGQSPRGRCHVV